MFPGILINLRIPVQKLIFFLVGNHFKLKEMLQDVRKDPDAEKHRRQEEMGMTEDKMVGWHHWLSGHEFGDGEGQRSLVCYSPWGRKKSCHPLSGKTNSKWSQLRGKHRQRGRKITSGILKSYLKFIPGFISYMSQYILFN